MDADDHVDDELQNAEDVRVIGAWVGAIKELEHPPHTKHPIDAHESEVDAKVQVEQVRLDLIQVPTVVSYHGSD